MTRSAKDPAWQTNGGRSGRYRPTSGRPRPGGGIPFVRVLIAAWLAALLLGATAAAAGSLVATAVEALAAPSWAGALDILLVGTLIGVVAGVPFLLFRARTRMGRRWLAAGWGAVVFAATAALLPEVARETVTELSPPAVVAFALLLALPFVGWGLALEKVAERLYFRFGPPKLELHSN